MMAQVGGWGQTGTGLPHPRRRDSIAGLTKATLRSVTFPQNSTPQSLSFRSATVSITAETSSPALHQPIWQDYRVSNIGEPWGLIFDLTFEVNRVSQTGEDFEIGSSTSINFRALS
jgi:hypothetical protein